MSVEGRDENGPPFNEIDAEIARMQKAIED